MTEKFQQIISQVIKDCPGAYNMSDDSIIVGATQEEHAIRLEKVVQKLNEHGLTLNATKCQINVPELTYMGHVLTSRGLQVSDEKVKAIVNAPPPKDRSEVQSFLELAQFCAKFIPNFASITSPLWDLTGDVEWKWTESEENAFREVKSCLTRAPVMAYFTPGLPTRIMTDASPVSLGAILEQKQSDGEYRPVYYVSRKLTDTESRYSQFEREALGVYWAWKRFYLYLIGIEFEILTDHKPLVSVLGASEKLSEGERRNLIFERNAARKQKQKEFADKHRLAHTSDIHKGDTVLVKQLHKTNKLTPNFEPVPSQVIRKDGNVVIYAHEKLCACQEIYSDCCNYRSR